MRCLAVAAGALLLAACGGPSGQSADGTAAGQTARESYVQAHNIKDLMNHVIQVHAQKFWGSTGFIMDETGEHDLTPTTDEGWQETRSAAATVAETGNLLMTPPYAQGRGADWIEFSRALVQVGMRAEQAALKRDTDAMLEVGATIDRVCEACHMAYPPAAGEPGGPATAAQPSP